MPSRDDYLGFGPGVVDLIGKLELALTGHGYQRCQQAIAAVLWRHTNRYPFIAGTVDFELVSVEVFNGGRLVQPRLRFFPERGSHEPVVQPCASPVERREADWTSRCASCRGVDGRHEGWCVSYKPERGTP